MSAEVRSVNVCVDVDGTLAEYDEWNGIEDIGDPLPGAVQMMQNLHGSWANDRKIRLILHTTRTNPDPFGDGNRRHEPEEAAELLREWCEEHDIPFDEIWTGEGKPIASVYIDDRALVCNPQKYDDEWMQSVTFETVEDDVRRMLRAE